MVRAPWLPLLGLLLALPAAAQQPVIMPAQPGVAPGQVPPRDTSARTGTARLRGHVYAADSGAPLRRARVRLSSPELREGRVTMTDAQGAYEFKDLPAGRYNINADKGSYVGLGYGQTRPLEPGKPIEILDGQTIEKVDFALPRGAVITGRVLDEYGEPVADVQVMPMQMRYAQGRRRMLPSGRSSSTNDAGEFRIFGLAPGQYYLSAVLRNMMFGSDSDDRSGYAPTYFPGTANPAEAQRIRVDLGQTLSDVIIALATTRTAKASGTVTDAQGRPLASGMVMAMPRGNTGMFFGPTGNGPIRPDGTFVVPSLPPGEYLLRANVGMGQFDTPEFATAEITVSGEDVSGIRLTTTRMLTVSGRVVVQDQAAAQALKPPLRLVAMPVNPDDLMFGGNGPGNVKDDFTFELRVAPGRFRIGFGGPMPNWAIRAVRQNGVDVTDSGVEVTAGSDASGIEVELTNRISDVSGVATNPRGEAARDYTVLIFSQDREQWSSNTRYRAIARPDQEGRFRARPLPPGRYYAVALDAVDMNETADPEFLERIYTKATTFTLNEGETKVIELKVQKSEM
jgi:protocatechuate 3,4-dioxygenase beta subunit